MVRIQIISENDSTSWNYYSSIVNDLFLISSFLQLLKNGKSFFPNTTELHWKLAHKWYVTVEWLVACGHKLENS